MEDNQNNPTPVESASTERVINVQVHEEESSPGIIPTVEAAGDPPADEATQDMPATPEQASSAPDNTPASAPAPTPHKPAAPIAAIVAAIVVAIGLAAVTVYAYQKSQNDANSDKYSLPTTQSDSNKTDDTATEVNAASTEVDNALKSVDETDFSETELSDQSLNL